MEAVEPLAGEELERMLARFARVRLEPSQGQARRARAAAMEEAWRRHLDPDSVLRASGATSRHAAAATRHGRFRGWGPRRVAVAFVAASMTGLLVGSSVFAASRAGGPLYESRLALESLTLPADPAARAAAQLARADARLGEAVDAGFRHDDHAVAAALDAYDEALQDVSTTRGAAAGQTIAAIQRHRNVLLQLAAQAPATATNGIDLALSSSDRAIDALGGSAGGSDTGDGDPHGNGPATNGAGKPDAGDGHVPGGGLTGGATHGAGNGVVPGNATGAGTRSGTGAGTGSGAGAGNGAGTGTGTATGNGNANSGGNGNAANGGGTGPKPAAGTPAPTGTPTPSPTVAPTEKPNTAPQHTHGPTHTPKPSRTSAPRHASSIESAIPSPSPAASDAP